MSTSVFGVQALEPFEEVRLFLCGGGGAGVGVVADLLVSCALVVILPARSSRPPARLPARSARPGLLAPSIPSISNTQQPVRTVFTTLSIHFVRRLSIAEEPVGQGKGV